MSCNSDFNKEPYNETHNTMCIELTECNIYRNIFDTDTMLEQNLAFHTFHTD